MATLTQDLKLALRMLWKRPGFSVVAVLVMALGIGANTAIFSVVYAALLQRLPFGNADRIVQLWHVPPQSSFPGVKRFALSAANYLDWRKQNHVFDAMALYTYQHLDLTGKGRPETITGAAVTSDFFSVLGVQPLYGRVFLPEEDAPGRNRELVLSYRFWQTHFAADPDVVGTTVQMSGEPYTIVGVMGPRMLKPDRAAVWTPMGMTGAEAAVRSEHHYLAIARLKNGVSLAAAQAEMDAISRRLETAYPQDNRGWGALVVSLREETVGDVRPVLLLMMGAVTFVLLIGCANVANLILARTLERGKEVAIRTALGAGRGQLIRQVLVEAVVLSVCGGVLGLAFAYFGIQLLVRFFAVSLPQMTGSGLNPTVLLFTLVVSVMTGLAAGFVPAWTMSYAKISDSLKQGLGRADTGAGRARTRSALVVVEVALSFMLLIGAGLMIRSLVALQRTNPGFDPRHVVVADVSVSRRTFQSVVQESQFVGEVLTRLRGVPGVEAAGAVDDMPLVGGSNQPIAVEGQPVRPLSEQPEVSVRVATPGYFRTMRIPLLQGRDFSDGDTADSAAVVVISQSMARQFWPNGDAVGHHLKLSFFPDRDRQIVGVVGDVKQNGLDTDVGRASLYWPLAQTGAIAGQPWRPLSFSLVVRSTGEPQAMGQTIAAAVHALNSDLPVQNTMALEEFVGLTLSQPTFNMQLLMILGALALVLSLVGIYSVLAYTVRRRMRELALRMALGAGARDVVRMVVLYGLKPTFAGILIGLAGTALLGRLMLTVLYGVKPTDTATLVTVTALMTVVAIGASLVPALRAARIDPARVLREE